MNPSLVCSMQLLPSEHDRHKLRVGLFGQESIEVPFSSPEHYRQIVAIWRGADVAAKLDPWVPPVAARSPFESMRRFFSAVRLTPEEQREQDAAAERRRLEVAARNAAARFGKSSLRL